jgi:hypothetical protein
MAFAPAPIYCIELRRLKAAYTWAVSEYLRLQSAQLASILNGDSVTFQKELHGAEMRKNEAKYAVLAHREAHGCGE